MSLALPKASASILYSQIALLSLLSCAACSSTLSRKAAIDDLSHFQIVEVDGQAPKRRSSSYVTMIPYVELTPGQHTLLVILSSPSKTPPVLAKDAPDTQKAKAKPVRIEAKVVSGKIYEIVRDKGSIRLRERENPHTDDHR